MGVDIDKFLNTLDSKEKPKEEAKEKQVVDLDLNFEKGVSETLGGLQKDFSSQDMLKLKEIYEKLKEFDQSIPSKFLSVESNSSSTLNLLNEQYSSKLLAILQNNCKVIEDQLVFNIAQIKEDILSKKFKISVNKLQESKDLLKEFPEEFLEKKFELHFKLRKIDIMLHNEIKNFKEKEFPHVRQALLQEVKNLQELLLKNNKEKILSQVAHIEQKLHSVPLIFKHLFYRELTLIEKILLKAEQKVLDLDKKSFDRKVKEVHTLQDKFHNAVIKKDLNSALLIYNEMLLFFEDIPSYDFAKKNVLLSTISNLHSQLNNLYVKNNVELFLSSYKNSKIIEEARDYLDQISLSKQISLENVNLILDKLKKLPKSAHIEQEALIIEYQKLLLVVEKKQQVPKAEENNLDLILKAKDYLKNLKKTKSVDKEELRTLLRELSFLPEEEKLEHKQLIDTLLQLYNKLISNVEKAPEQKEVTNDTVKEAQKYLQELRKTRKPDLDKILDILNTLENLPYSLTIEEEKLIERYQKIKDKISEKKEKKNSLLYENASIDNNVSKEVEILFGQLKDTKIKKEATILYKKIHFYLDLLHINKEKKQQIHEKVKEAYSRV